LESTVTVNFSMASRYLIQLIGGVVLLFVISWKLTLIMLAVIPVIGIVAIIYGRWVKSLGKRYQDALAKTTDIAEESLGNVRTVRSFAQERKQIKTYGDAIDESFTLSKLLSLARGTFGGVMMILGQVSIIGVVWYGGVLVIDGELTIVNFLNFNYPQGSLTSFIIYTLTVAFAFGALASLYFDVSQASNF
jgi:ABC-type multidrug transport system fused ATPase/permease subunit